ncbi:MAG: MarC family protein [Proteobacteria bacterium]|nr:MarC family protein [Pseudomonadota bacterium]
MNWLQSFSQVFLPLFVAIDVIALVPIFLTLTENLNKRERSKLIHEACLTVLLTSIVFLWTGRGLFSLLGITSGDFKVGGGLLLLLISINNLMKGEEASRRNSNDQIGVVPIGIPLILGPAALTTLLISSESVGFSVSLAALLINVLIVWVTLQYSSIFLRIFGTGGTKAVAKIAALFLTAIAVHMIRMGLNELGIIH